jgi:hypothetical protein
MGDGSARRSEKAPGHLDPAAAPFDAAVAAALAAGDTTALAALDPAERDELARALDRWLEAAGLTELPATMFFEDDRAPSRPAS